MGAGLLYSLAFSPIDFKIGIFISLVIYFYILINSTIKSSLFKSYLYGIAVFTSGVSWIFNSIYYHGGEHLFFSLIMTLIFILFVSIFFIPIGYIINKGNNKYRVYYPAIVSSTWVLMEIIRSNIFGGFPWLLAGFSQTGTIFDYLYPVFGVYFVSFIIVMISMMLLILIFDLLDKNLLKIYSGIIISIFVIVSLVPIKSINTKDPLKITIIQPNINLGIKYNESQLDNIKQEFLKIMDNPINDLVVMPETAIPKIYQLDKEFYANLLKKFDINLITGIFNYDRKENKIHNSILLLTDGNKASYDKRHLVPFGEYTPLRNIFGILSDIMNIPMSDISHGRPDQPPMYYKGMIVYPLVCYEIAYPSLINISNNEYGIIVNLSNDAWFGDSFAPYQHLQIAQVRALETSMPIIRAANTGVSAVIHKDGTIINRIELNRSDYINVDVYPSKGITPYMYFGDYPTLMLIFSIMLLYWKYHRKNG